MAELRFEVDEGTLAILSNAEIKANFAETKAALEEMVEPYKGVLVDSSNLRESKADIARIRKLERSIDEYRKMVKRYVLVPVTAFEDKCKELIAVCTDAYSTMDAQVKEIERQQKEAKINALREFFDNAEKKYPDYCSFEDVYRDQWENKTVTVDSCQNEILAYIAQVEKDIDIIKSMKSEDEVILLMRYAETKDLWNVMDYNKTLAEAREQKRAEEEERKRLEQERIETEKRKVEEMTHQSVAHESEPIFDPIEELPISMPEEIPEPVIPTKKVRFVFNVCGTPAQIASVEEGLIRMGIKDYRLDYFD